MKKYFIVFSFWFFVSAPLAHAASFSDLWANIIELAQTIGGFTTTLQATGETSAALNAAAVVAASGTTLEVPELFKLPPCSVAGGVGIGDVALGDVTGDGKITAEDADAVQKFATGQIVLSNLQKKAADVNGKDGITGTDAALIRGLALGLSSTFPVCTADTAAKESSDNPINSFSLSACGTITKSGAYTLANDLMSKSGNCLLIKDTHDVSIDCAGRKISSAPIDNGSSFSSGGLETRDVSFENVENFSLKSCVIHGDGATPLFIKGSTGGEITGNTFGYLQVKVEQSKNLVFKDNTFDSAVYGQVDTQGTTLEHNTLVFNPTTSHLNGVTAVPGMIYTTRGVNTRIVRNTIDGGTPAFGDEFTSFTNHAIGADDGIILDSEKTALVENNSIKNAWDCGIETVGALENSKIQNNQIQNTWECGIGGWFWNRWKDNTVRGNTVKDSTRLFVFSLAYGLRPGESSIYFTGNTFEGNTLTRIPTASPAASLSTFDFTPPASLSGIAGERLPLPSEITAANNRFTNNNFGSDIAGTRLPPSFNPASLVVDGGGNQWSISPPSAPTITVISPTTSYLAGSTMSIVWRASGVSSVKIEICWSNRTLCSAVVSSVGARAFQWSIPVNGPYVGKRDIEVKITDLASGLVSYSSNPISIFAPSSPIPTTTPAPASYPNSVSLFNPASLTGGGGGNICGNIPAGYPLSCTGVVTERPLLCGSVGDMNHDGRISKADAELVRLFALELRPLTEAEKKDADLNNDGKVSTLDLNYYSNYLANPANVFPKCAKSKPLVPSCGSIGDVNNDGRISDADIETARSGILGISLLTDAEKKATDVNGVNGATSLDLTLLTRYLLGLETTFPACAPSPVGSANDNTGTIVNPQTGATATTNVTAPVAERPLLCGSVGDLNHDGKISKADAELLRLFALDLRPLTEAEKKDADLNSDGKVSTLDLVYYSNYLADAANVFPKCALVKPLVVGCGSVGDVNGDGRISAADIETARSGILGISELTDDQKKAGDVNGLGGLTTLDIVFMTRYLNGLDASFPACTPPSSSGGAAAPVGGAATSTASKPRVCGFYGDVNFDSVISQADIDLLRAHVLGIKTLDANALAVADLNNDQKVSTLDITYLTGYLAGKQATFPVCKAQPSITVLSPNGGESYRAGEMYRIKWNTSGVTQPITIYLAEARVADTSSGQLQNVAVNLPAISTYYDWHITPQIPSGNYKIIIQSVVLGQYSFSDKSDDSFYIASQSQGPSITVQSPNGGEVYKAGEQVVIKWSSANIASHAINYIGLDTPSVAEIAYDLTGSSYTWTIPTTLAPGRYRIVVGTSPTNDVNTVVASDSSDSYFTVTSAASGGGSTAGKPVIANCGSLGDVNGDGRISEEDKTLIRNHTLGVAALPALQLKNADTNGNASITTLDIALITGYLEGSVSRFAGCDIPALTVACAPSAPTASTGDPVAWSVQASGGAAPYAYAWTGDDKIEGNGTTVSVAYSSSGSKTASVNVTSGFETVERSCGSITVSEKPLHAKVTAPTGGTFEIGDSLFISWTTDNAGTSFSLYLRSSAGVNSALIETKAASASNSTTWTVPSGTAAGEYRIGILKGDVLVDESLLFTLRPKKTTAGTGTKPRICGVIGDVNDDGSISSADADLARTFVLGTAVPTDAQKTAADTTGNGSVTTLDINYITGYLAGVQTTFPACPQ